MKYAANGSVLITATKDAPGLFSKDGFTQVTDQTSNPALVGLYAPDGSLNVSLLLNETVRVPALAPNGSVYVVEGAGTGIYSPCGAMNVTDMSDVPLSLAVVDTLVTATDAGTYNFASSTLGSGLIVIAGTIRAGAAITITSLTVAGVAATVDVTSTNGSTSLTFIAHVVNTAAFGDIVLTLSGTAARVGLTVYKALGYTQAAPYLTGTATRTSTAGSMSPNLTGAISEGFIIAVAFNGLGPGHRLATASALVPAGTNHAITATIASGSSSWTGLTEDDDIEMEVTGTGVVMSACSAAFR